MGWIIDSGARNLMTYDQVLIKSITSSPWDGIVTTNYGVVPVTWLGSKAVTPTLSLHNYILVPTLLNNLLSVVKSSSS